MPIQLYMQHASLITTLPKEIFSIDAMPSSSRTELYSWATYRYLVAMESNGLEETVQMDINGHH